MALKETSLEASIPIPSPVPNGYDPGHVGIQFRLGVELRSMSLLEFGWRVGLYSQSQSRENHTRISLQNAVTVKAERLLLEFWPTIKLGYPIVALQ
ncbi:hypothetical protein Tco_1499806 [Tanacetum coccineum]